MKIRSLDVIKKLTLWFTLAAVLGLGLGIRLYDLTDLPFDYQPTRQMRSALIARGMYYQNLEGVPAWQREAALEAWQREAVIEPPVLEWLVATLYRLTGAENLWYARLLSSVFWVLGGLAIFLFGRELGSEWGGVLSAAYFLFLPFGMIASRTFQPDPLMTALIAWALWGAIRWNNWRTPGSAAAAGLLAGAAILVKTVAVFMLGGALAGLVLGRAWRVQNETGQRPGARAFFRALFQDRQTWIAGALAILPTGLYFFYGLFIDGFLQRQFQDRFFPEMWRDPAFYIRWVEMATDIAGFTILAAGLVGVFLLRDRALRGMAIGLWLGYGAYSMTFPFHTMTHDYYQLPLIPIAAVSIVPFAALVFTQVLKLDNRKAVIAVIAVAVAFAVLFKVWDTRVILARRDHRNTSAEWARFQEILPAGHPVAAMVQTYGYPLSYFGWINAKIWLADNDAFLRSLSGQSDELIEKKRFDLLEENDFFLITNFNEFDRQDELKDLLYSSYPIYDEGPGYIIFDLRDGPQP